MEYKIAIFEKDRVYLERLVSYLRAHHEDRFKVSMPEFEITDLEEVKYDVIFVGDGMEAVLEDIADDTIIAYITGNNSNQNKSTIYKYQKPEQIYNQMIKICEDNKFENKTIEKNINIHNVELTTQEDKYGSYKVLLLTEDAIIDNVAIEMLANNRIEGIAGIIRFDDSIKYKVTDKVSLTQYLQLNKDKYIKNKLLKIISNILNTMLSLEEYLLDLDKVVLNPNYIYVDENTLECELIYYPLQCGRSEYSVEDILKAITDICNRIIKDIKNDEEDNINDIFANEINTVEAEKFETENTEIENTESEDNDMENIEIKENDEFGSTEIFTDLQNKARESVIMKEHTDMLSENNTKPFIVRRKTGEKVIINRNIFKIGKDESYVDYCIKNNPTVSRNHADIIKKPDGYYIVDKGSLNHTFINGRRIESKIYKRLEDGDLVQLADEVFEYKLDIHKNED